MVGNRDANAGQRLHHAGRHREVVPLHPHLGVHHGDDRAELRVGAKELILGRRLANGDGNDAGSTGTFHTRKVAT